MISFANPLYLTLLVVPLLMLLWYFMFKRKHEPALRISSTEAYRRPIRTLRTSMIHLPFVLRTLAVTLLIIALARPQTQHALREREVEGIDILLTIDISTSMLTPDIKPSRISAAREVAVEFVQNRPNDNIGLVLFGGEAFMQCPPTTDHASLLSLFDGVNCSLAENGYIASGTAIGMGLAASVAHLQDSKSKSKVVILLTDGVDNTGEISPQTAAELAKQANVRVYTISIGKPGKSKQAIAQLPNGEYYEAEVDNTANPEVLKRIAQTTGGEFYTADSREQLKAIYQEIDGLEKSQQKVRNYDKRYDAYQFFLFPAFIFFLLEVLLRMTWLKRIP